MTNDKRSVHWDHLTLEEVGEAANAGVIVVLPVGATEQHGPHLATGTDSFFAETLAAAAAAETGDLVLPTLAYGCSLGHTDRWPGTVSLDPETMARVVVEIGRWVYASGFRKLVIVNGHATNGPPCQSAILKLRHELPEIRMRFVSIFDITPEVDAEYTKDAPDWHANEAEASLMLHLDPSQIRSDRIVDEEDRTVGRVFQYAVPVVSVSGAVGRPSGGTAASGERLFSIQTQALVDLLEQARTEQDPEL